MGYLSVYYHGIELTYEMAVPGIKALLYRRTILAPLHLDAG